MGLVNQRPPNSRKGNLQVSMEVKDRLRDVDYVGTIIDQGGWAADSGYEVMISGMEYFFFNRELTLLVGEKEIDPNLSRSVNLTGD